MKLHTNLTRDDVLAAGHLAGVRFERLDESGSRTHARKFDVILTGSGRYGGQFGGDYRTATWDEWGIFLNRIFNADPDARAAGYYECREQFRWNTARRFDDLTPAQQHLRHRWHRGEEYSQGCACGAIRRWDPPRQATGSGPVRPVLRRWAEAMDALPMDLGEIFGEAMADPIGSRYESNGRYARELGIVEKIGEVLADD